MRVADHGVQVHLLEGHLPGEVHAHHHHPGHPEEQNVVARLQEGRGVERLEVRRLVGPLEDGEGEQPRAEPRVQHVLVLRQLDVLPRVLLPGIGHGLLLRAADDPGGHVLAGGPGPPGVLLRLALQGDVVRGDAVAPPQLPADAPVPDVLQPPEPRGVELRGDDLQPAVPGGRAAVGRHLLAVDPPLGLQDGLDDVLGARAQAESHGVVRLAPEQALGLEELGDLHAALEPGHPRELPGPVAVDAPDVVQDVDTLELVPLAGGKVVGVVRGSDLHRPGSEAHVHQDRVCNDGNLPAVHGVPHVLAVQVGVPRVLRVDGHGGVPQHGLDTRRGDHDLAVALLQRVSKTGDDAELDGLLVPRH
mmetsp:Transcript_6391/g.18099  ORF Transcript_6391/g.18099 Transcript_6391/m.18099 type:complete len:361 (-) Transcript_6391:857-1939(-)